MVQIFTEYIQQYINYFILYNIILYYVKIGVMATKSTPRKRCA